MADAEARSVSALLSGIANNLYFTHMEVTEELLRVELYPELSQDDFSVLHDKMKGLLKSIATADMDQAQLDAFLTAQTRRQGGGLSTKQAAALSRFWKNQRARVRESLLAKSRWGHGLRNVSWRVDLQTTAAHAGPAHTGPTALMELELGGDRQDSEFVCVEFNEARLSQVLEKMAEVEASVDRLAWRS